MYAEYTNDRRVGRAKNIPWSMLFAFALFVQLGVSINVSVATVGFLLLLTYAQDLRLRTILILLVLISIGISTLSGVVAGLDVNLLQQVRIAVVTIGYVLLVGSNGINAKGKLNIPLIATLLFVGVLMQAISQNFGKPLAVPAELFAISEDGALAAKWLEFASERNIEYRFRPAFTYSEPSYLGFIAFSLGYIGVHYVRRAREKLVMYAALIGVVLVAQTLYGLISLALLFALTNAKSSAAQRLSGRGVGLIALIVVSILLIANTTRGSKLIRGEDLSAVSRIAEPVLILPATLSEFPLGIPLSVASDGLRDSGVDLDGEEGPFHNALFNVVIAYGYMSPLIFLALLAGLRSKVEVFYVLIAMAQNGSFFSFDKLYVVAMSIMIARTAIQQRSPQLR